MTIPKLRKQANENEIIIGCIRAEGYMDVVGGKDYKFNPGDVFAVEEKFGRFLLNRAHRAWQMQHEQAKHEREEWGRRISSQNQYVKDTALKFCDKNGKPLTKTYEREGLVDLTREDGKKVYKEFCKANKIKKSVPGILEPEDTGEDVGTIADESAIVAEAPQPDWTKEQKLDYIKRYAHITGLKAWGGLVAREDMAETLDKRVRETFEILRERQGEPGVDKA